MKPTIHTDKYDLYLGDCLPIMREMPAGSVDAILTDIPSGTTQCSWDEIIPFVPMWEGVKRLLKPRGVFVTTASQPFTSKLVMSNLGWFKYEWIWDKVNGANFGNVAYSPFKTHENIEIFCDGVPKTYNPIYRKVSSPFGKISLIQSEVTANKTKPTRQGVGYPASIIRIMRPNNLSDGGYHPTQKPIVLYRYIVETYTNIGDVVLGFTMGSGTTGVACMQLGRKFIGIEIDPKYFEIAEKRIRIAAMQDPLFTV